MSNHLTSEVYKRQMGGIARNAVMVLLADKASDDGSGIWASKSRMAAELDCTKQTVISIIRGLIADGLVRACGHRANANGYTVEYAINVAALRRLPLVPHHADRSTDLTGQNGEPVNEADLTGQAARPHRSKRLTQTPLNPSEPKGGAREAREPTPDLDPGSDGWEPPAIAALPDKARALVQQWPAGAYQAICETFRLHWLARGCDTATRRRPHWPSLLARWLMADHAKVMRDAKAGVSFAALVPATPGAAGPAPQPVAAQADESEANALHRAALRSIIAPGTYARLIEPAALLPAPDGGWVLVVGSEFQRSWIEANLLPDIRAALGSKLVKIEVERPAGAKRGAAK